MLPLLRITLLVFLGPGSCDNTVVDGIGSHMIDRLSELLSPEECQSFYTKITGSEENRVLNLEWFSDGDNPIRTRRRRDIISTEQCKKTLSHWLDAEGDTMYWDRLSEALQAIGRSDVSMELSKNLSQDKILEIKKNMEEYHKTVQHQSSSVLLEENKMCGQERRCRLRTKTVPESEKWDKLKLNVERKSLALYNQDKSMEMKENVQEDHKMVQGQEENEMHGREQQHQDRQETKTVPEPEQGIKTKFTLEWKSVVPYNRSLLGWGTPVVVAVFSGLISAYVLVALALYSHIWFLNEGRTESFLEKMLPPYFPLPQGGAVYYMYQQFDESGNDDTEPASGDDDDCSSWYEEFLFQS